MKTTLQSKLASAFMARIASAQWVELDSREERNQYRDAIWDMLVDTYREIGVKLSSKAAMDEYDVWTVALIDGQPVAFNLSTKTPFGVKFGLSGSNGTTGKRVVVEQFKKLFKDGFYSEVSHKVEHLCEKMGVPVVCAEHAKAVLKKQLDVQPDGIHYSRTLSGIGVVTKVLVGKPRGVPTTSWDAPDCPIDGPEKLASTDPDKSLDHLSHYACNFD